MARIDVQLIRMMLLYRSLLRYPERKLEDLSLLISEEMHTRGYSDQVSVSTIKRDIEKLKELDVDVSYNRRLGRFIVETGPRWSEFEHLINPLKVLTSMGRDAGVPEFIFPERYETKGLQHIDHVITAIQHRYLLTFDYYKYQSEVWQERNLYPEVLKEWRGRWYVLGRTPEGERRIFGLDRIKALRLGHTSSGETPNIAIYHEAFKQSYGIYASDDFPVEELILHFDREDGNYLRSRPMHSSQEIIGESEDSVTLKFRMRITADLIMELLSRANSIRIERPLWLREECLRRWHEAIERNK